MARSGTQILKDEYYSVHRIEGGVLWAARSPIEFPDADAIRGAAEALRLAFAPFSRAQTGLVVDLREVRGRADSTFESVWAPLRKELFSGWAAVSVVCETQVGRMHVQRHMRQDGLDWHVVVDPDEALAFARAAAS